MNKTTDKIQWHLQGLHIIRLLNIAKRSEYISTDEIERIQFGKLKKLIIHSYNTVPFYHNLFDKLNLKTQTLNIPQDIKKIPILTKEIVRNNINELISSKYEKERLIKAATGGSTGEPMTFYLNKEHYAHRLAGQQRFWQWTGYKPGDSVFCIWGARQDIKNTTITSLSKWNRLLDNFGMFDYRKMATGKTYIDAYSLSDDAMRSALANIKQVKPKLIYGYASSLYLLAKYAMKNMFVLGYPVVVISTAEVLYDEQKKLIETVFGGPVYNEYGAREVGVIAQNCGNTSHLHVNVDNVYLEIIKPDGGDAKENEVGNAIVTDLYNYAMPLIRYRNDDLAQPVKHDCVCGRKLPLVNIDKGRIFDNLISMDNKYIYGQYFTQIFFDYPEVKKFQIIQVTRDKIVVKIIKADDYTATVEDGIKEKILLKIGSGVTIEFEYTLDIPPLRSGKQAYVISNLNAY